MKARRRKVLGTEAGWCGMCEDERDLQVYESWEPRGLFGLGRDETSVQRVRSCPSCGFKVRGSLLAA